MMSALLELGPFDSQGHLNVVIGAPPENSPGPGRLRVSSPVVLKGADFVFDCGHVPGTRGGDGGPLNVLMILDSPVSGECVVGSRLIGVIIEVTRNGSAPDRNERLIALPARSTRHAGLESIEPIATSFMKSVERFFSVRRAASGRMAVPVECHGSERAREILHVGLRNRFGACLSSAAS